MAELVSRRRLLASHCQFYAFDQSRNPVDPLPEINEEVSRRGWARTPFAIHYFTVGQLWEVRLDIFRSSEPPDLNGAERLLCHSLHLPTGVLCVGNPIADGNTATVNLTPGEYSLYLRAFNVGVEAEAELDDETFLARTDLERCELFVVLGPAPREGVILGSPSIW